MKIIINLFRSTLGKKIIMAGSGIALFLFVVGHLLGNLQIFLGPEAINRYGHFLQTTPELLWSARLGLLLMVVLHIWAAVRLSLENKAARPVPYAGNPTPVAASFASRTMLMSGLIILAFIIYHLAHFTLQVPDLNLTGTDFRNLHDSLNRHDVHRMMVLGFSNPVVAGFYILAIGLLCMHLSHGLQALFSSLGLKSPAHEPLIRQFAVAASWVIFLGYISIPIAVWSGFVKEVMP